LLDFSLEQARRIAALVQDKLGRDVLILDMQPVCAYTDYFAWSRRGNPRQTKAIWDEVHGRLKQEHDLPAPLGRRRDGGDVDRRRLRPTSCCTSSPPRRGSTTRLEDCGTTFPHETFEAATG